MITVHTEIAENMATKPMECPCCGFKRAFDVPSAACVRKSKRGKPPPGLEGDLAIFKCKKCGHPIGVSVTAD
jgi:DNA-directed RNA polymerase subunit RPC12/RpoP